MTTTGQVIYLLRPGQWTKNGLVLAPAFFAGIINQPSVAWRSVTAFILFCAASSAIYVFNDIMDRHRDRLHPAKRHRPMVSGGVNLPTAWVLAVGLSALSIWGSHTLNFTFICMITAYLAQGWAYSLYLKRIPFVDVLSVSAGFLLRILGGGAAVDVMISPWLLICALALSLLLGFGKRRADAFSSGQKAPEPSPLPDGYSLPFLDQAITITATTTLVSYIFYAACPETIQLFGTRAGLLTIVFVLYGLFRYLSQTHRNQRRQQSADYLSMDIPMIVVWVGWTLTWVAIIYLT